MAFIDVGVEIGTSNTSIFVSGSGIVLYEPTIVAFFADESKIRGVGIAASEMQGRVAKKTTVVSPVIDGVISDPSATKVMLKAFLKKITPNQGILAPRFRAVVSIPTGLTQDERKCYEDVCIAAGIAEPIMVEGIILSALGMDLPIHIAGGNAVVNIGGGKTEVAVMSAGGIVSGFGVNIGGNAFDIAIKDIIAGKHRVKIGLPTARRVKEELASLYANDTAKMTISGTDIRTGSPTSAVVSAYDTYQAIAPLVAKIADTIAATINECPPETAGAIKNKGIHLCGGCSKIVGMDVMLSKILGLPVHVPENPLICSILGAGRLISDYELLTEILSQN